MPYPVINTFEDLEQNKQLYKKGETYPKEGYEVDSKRVKLLQSTENKYKKAFLGPEIQNESGDREDQSEVDLSTLTAAELEKVKKDDIQSYLKKNEIEFNSTDNKDELIKLVLKEK
jgi:hypothetical protein